MIGWAVLAACTGPDSASVPIDPTEPTLPEPTPTVPEEPPRCGPLVVEAASHWVEGDLVSVELVCTTAPPDAVFVVSLEIAPPGATIDGRRITFPTDLDDAGPIELFVSLSRGVGVPETVVHTVSITDAGPDVPGNAPVDPATYVTEFGLPVVHVTPLDTVSETYVPADFVFDGTPYPDVQIKLRGAASVTYPKAHFTLKFGSLDLDGDRLGLPNKEHLVLISSFDDNSYLRQKLEFDLWAEMAAAFGVTRALPVPSYVVVYLAGAYHGLYVAIDHVDDEFFGEAGWNRDGELFKSVNHDANFKRVLASGAVKTDLSSGWEKKEGLPIDDFTSMVDLTAFVDDTDPSAFAATGPDWVQVDEFMDWYLLVAFSAAADSAGKNAYLYRDPLSAPALFRFVPWDFNHAWGQDWTTARVSVSDFSDFRWNNEIFAHFHDDPASSAAMWARYEAFAAPGGPMHAETLLARIDADLEVIDPSARRDWAQWEDDYYAYSRWSSRTDFTDFDGEVAYLRDWITQRPAAFDAARP